MRVRWWIAGLLVWLLGGALASEGQTLLFRVDDPVPQARAYFGAALAGVGDVDADGVPDLAVGDPSQNVAGQDNQGRVFVFSGATGVGDVDGDGVPDLAVGAPVQDVYDRQDQERVADQGRAFVFSLGATP